jgi:hypothetical protein
MVLKGLEVGRGKNSQLSAVDSRLEAAPDN